eukprot:TRINITY_DN4960_c0_g2_i5.p1 TRINITY_DN4960_c0_g2~~TRINITY_DN4960_c0_g2_i5.p1  ORF type:complete len:1101 (-),score=288.20 TRINITY_DN4960_c0_g2_i5:144-3410(-)
MYVDVRVPGCMIVDVLKGHPAGLTEKQLENQLRIEFTQPLRDWLGGNPWVESVGGTWRMRRKGKEVEEGAAVVLADWEACGIEEAVVVEGQSRKVVFRRPKVIGRVSAVASEEARVLWQEIPAHLGGLNLFLQKHNLPLASLDSNRPHKIPNLEKKVRKGLGKEKEKSGLALFVMGLLGKERGEEECDGGVVEEKEKGKEKVVKENLSGHNEKANPEEFEVVSDMVRIVGFWFYEEIYAVVLNEFLKKKRYIEEELVKILQLPKKQVSAVLEKLASHQLILKKNCEKSKKQFVAYTLDLDHFINAVNYRLFSMLYQENHNTPIFHCGNCSKKFFEFDLLKLAGTYNCDKCKVPISQTDNSQKQKVLERVKKDMQPLNDIITKLTKKPSTRRAHNLPTTRVSTKSAPEISHHTVKLEEITSIPDLPISDFDTNPIYFADNNEVLIPVCKDLDEINRNVALRLSKTLLDGICEFKKIINAREYLYQITVHSLHLAWWNGYSPEEIIRLLKSLSKNPMTLALEQFIRDHTNNTYYRATVTLRENKKENQNQNQKENQNKNKENLWTYCVQSPHKQLLVSLLSKHSLRDLVPNTTQLVEVKRDGNETCYYFPINPGASENIKKACRVEGIPLIDEFDCTRTMPSIAVDMKKTTQVRFYQGYAVSRLFWNSFKCHSGILVLPCGAGKTLIGISVIAALKKRSIIFCQSNLAVNQWRNQLLQFTTIKEGSISRFSARHKEEWNSGADVIITSYPMFSSSKLSEDSRAMMEQIKKREWGLLLLDEVHLAPAKTFRKVTNHITSHVKLGLTATMVREDDLIEDLPHLVGPVLHEVDIFTLRMHKFISPVECVELHCAMPDVFMSAYNSSENREQNLLYALNPNKIRVVWSLVKQHQEKKHRIMVFCDNLICLEAYTAIINNKIDGNTPDEKRSKIFKQFRQNPGECILISQVGDQSIDLPEADVVIQVALMHGGRMQEGQRIGRIQRYQEGKATGFFYSLVSEGTREVQYAEKRRTFLEDHGYIINTLKGDSYKRYLDGLEILNEEHNQKEMIVLLRNELDNKEQDKANRNQQPQNKRKREPEPQKEISKRIKRIT